MTVRNDSRIVFMAALLVTLAGSVRAADSASSRLDELKALVKDAKYAEAEGAARALLSEVEATKGPESVEAAEVIDVLVETLWRGGKAQDPEGRKLAERAVAIKERVLGPDHPDVATSLTPLANFLDASGDPMAARAIYERAVALREKALGPDHPDVAKSLNNLAILLMETGDYAAARPLYERALAIREKALGPDHPDVAQSLHSLAKLLGDTGDYADARPLYERALAIREKALGPDHLDVADSLNNLADLLRMLGDYAQARPLFERALAIREKRLGPEHPKVAMSLSNLADLLRNTGDYAAARPLYERALAIFEKALGPDHPYVAQCLNSLAMLLMETGDYGTARQLAERALAIREKTLGPDHPDVATSLNSLAAVLWYAGDYAGARPLYERALAIREKAFGLDNPDVVRSLSNLAMLLDDTGDYAAARPLYERSLAILEKALGPEHPDVAQGLNNLALLLETTGDFAQARPLFERALAIREKALGPDHPDVATSVNNLAILLHNTGDYAVARPLYERALAIREKALGVDHPDVAESLSNVANLLKDTGDYAAARPLYERALAVFEKAIGPDHPAVAGGLENLAILLISQSGDYAAARPLFERALAIREKALGPDHPDVAKSLNNLANLLEGTGDYATARPLLERALAIRNKALGPGHPDVAQNLNDLAKLLATMGDTTGAFDCALEAETIGREHLRLTGRSLSERQALRYAAVRSSGLDLAMTLAGRSLDPSPRRRVLDALVRSRAVVLDEMAARHHAASAASDPKIAALVAALTSARSRLANLTVRGPGELEPATYRKLLDDARSDGEQSERALAAASASFANELSRQRLGVDEVAASLPPGTALVAFAEYQKLDLTPKSPPTVPGERAPTAKDVPSYLAFVLRSGEKDPQVVDLGAAEAIDGLVADWRKEASGAGFESAYGAVGGSLRKSVWDRLTPAIGDANRVFVVPDGSLNLVSFAALPLDDGGYLIERGPLVHYLSAERDLVPSGGTGRGLGLLALGAPSYDATSMYASLQPPAPGKPPTAKHDATVLVASSTTYRGEHAACGDFASMRFGPLPGTGKESLEIVRLWEKYGPSGSSAPAATADLRDAAASETALKRSAPGRRVLHLATHGFFLGGECKSALESTRAVAGLIGASSAGADAPPPPVTGENPLVLSGLALAGANHRSAAGPGEDDGILTAEEIASLDLSGVEWAVLSACETGVGDVQVGEGVFGLRRAFQIAGARTLIMSLWSVDDEATRSWMKALYEGRLESHLDTAEAVRHASLEVLKDRRKRNVSTHPFYWAGFVAAGDWH